ncbi:MAG: hypothetical protein ABI273_14240 [Lacunisphaera sp.]
MSIDVPGDRLDALVKLFERNVNQSNLAFVTLTLGAYLEAITDEITDAILPSLSSANHAKKLRGLRDYPIIDDAAFQAATNFAYVRNAFAHSFEDRTLAEPDIHSHFQNFAGVVSKAFDVDSVTNGIAKKVQDHGKQHFGVADGVHQGFSGSDGERLKSAALFLCIHFLAVRYSLPAKGTPLAFGNGYEIKKA